LLLKDTIFCPEFAFTLLSVSRVDKAGGYVLFGEGKARLYSKDKVQCSEILATDGLYKLAAKKGLPSTAATVMSKTEAHRKLCHINHRAVEQMVKNGSTGIEIDPNSKEEFCEPCAKAKAATKPFPKVSTTRAQYFGQKTHTDLWGPAQVTSIDKVNYYEPLIDDMSRWEESYFLQRKSHAFSRAIVPHHAHLKPRMVPGRLRQELQMDRGGEFRSNEFLEFCEKEGIKPLYTVHDSPQQNGVAERSNRTRAELARAILIQSRLPRFLWTFAFRHITWLWNRAPHAALEGKSPYEILFGEKPVYWNSESLRGSRTILLESWTHDPQKGDLWGITRRARFTVYIGPTTRGLVSSGIVSSMKMMLAAQTTKWC
jgi:hypothetical protein